jgi:hypothetical protein
MSDILETLKARFEATKGLDWWCAAGMDEIERLRAEEISLTQRVGRLRLALEAIAYKGGETNAHGYALQQIAREALKNEAHE